MQGILLLERKNKGPLIGPFILWLHCFLCVERHAIDGAYAVEHAFAQGRVGVDDGHHLFDGHFGVHGYDGFGDQFSR